MEPCLALRIVDLSPTKNLPLDYTSIGYTVFSTTLQYR
jgi:hypothetical protein